MEEETDKTSKPPVDFTLECFARAETWAYLAYGAYQKAADDLKILDETGKDMLEAIKTELEVMQKEKVSEAKLERLARASKKWLDYRAGLYEAIKLAGQAKAKWLSTDRYWSTVQSGLAFKRDEMRKL